MPNFRNNDPMCRWNHDRLEEVETSEDDDMIYYPDGTSTHKGGGPCGPTNYDENGKEC